MNLDYYTSQQFIHDDLVESCEALVEDLPRFFAEQKGDVSSYVVAWPSLPFKDSTGRTTDDPVYFGLPEGCTRVDQAKYIRELTFKTSAFGLFLLEKTNNSIICIFESPLGTKSWIYPIQRRGDVTVLGTLRVETNTHRVGLLYSPGQAN